MNRLSAAKIYIAALISLLPLSIFTSLEVASVTAFHSARDPELYVDPVVYRATHVGETFSINVRIASVDASLRLIGAEFKLQYNNTLLETEEDAVQEGGFFKAFGATFSKTYIQADSQGRKYVHSFVLLLPSDIGNYSNFPQGDGTLATVTFKASYRPVAPTTASCQLNLFDIILVDPDLNTIQGTAAQGLYQIASLYGPTLEVLPKSHVALRQGETFDVRVNIKEVDRDWHLVGLQFKLLYNTSLLETRSEWITEGEFFKTYGTTWLTSLAENDYGIVGVMILPNGNSTWNSPFPEGEGTVATLRFRTVYQPVEPEPSSSCALMLTDTILVNDNSSLIPHNTNDGGCTILAASALVDQYRPIDVQVDVGTIHFSGEIADFYILASDYGKPVDPDNMQAVLYFEGAQYSNLTSSIKYVSRGLYRLPYTVPSAAQSGTYVLLVEAEYAQVGGTAIKSFLVSSTLASWNAYITAVKDSIATILVPSIGEIKANLSVINAELVKIEGDQVMINSTVGQIKSSVDAIHLKVVDIDWENKTAEIQTDLGTIKGYVENVDEGGFATINTELGTINAKVADLPANAQTTVNLLYIALFLALIAAMGAIIAAYNTHKKRP